ncbi:hypothetical protein G6F46_015810 [Rhizopus delemar]|nr:hypothetical protein G6F46_015810 [Rhizopus delemar]
MAVVHRAVRQLRRSIGRRARQAASGHLARPAHHHQRPSAKELPRGGHPRRAARAMAGPGRQPALGPAAPRRRGAD